MLDLLAVNNGVPLKYYKLKNEKKQKNNNKEGEEEAGQRMMQWEANSQNRTFVVVCLGNHSRNSSGFLCFKLKKKCIYLCIATKTAERI